MAQTLTLSDPGAARELVSVNASRGRFHFLNKRATFAAGNTYGTGIPIDASLLGLNLLFTLTVTSAINGSSAFLARWDRSSGKIKLYGAAGAAAHTHAFTTAAGGTGATGAEAAHTHTIPVTAGTAGDAVTNDAGTLNSTGGQDLTTSAGSSHTHTGPSHTHTGTTDSATVSTAGGLTELGSGVDIENLVIDFTAFGS